MLHAFDLFIVLAIDIVKEEVDDVIRGTCHSFGGIVVAQGILEEVRRMNDLWELCFEFASEDFDNLVEHKDQQKIHYYMLAVVVEQSLQDFRIADNQASSLSPLNFQWVHPYQVYCMDHKMVELEFVAVVVVVNNYSQDCQ